MNKNELVRRVAKKMREEDIRKPVSVKKHVFHISDDEGNSSDFVVKKTGKGVLFTCDDIEAVLNVIISEIESAVRYGEPVSLKGFGRFSVHYREQRTTKNMHTGERVVIPGRYVPKFNYGEDLRKCAMLYDLDRGVDNVIDVDKTMLDWIGNVSEKVDGSSHDTGSMAEKKMMLDGS